MYALLGVLGSATGERFLYSSDKMSIAHRSVVGRVCAETLPYRTGSGRGDAGAVAVRDALPYRAGSGNLLASASGYSAQCFVGLDDFARVVTQT